MSPRDTIAEGLAASGDALAAAMADEDFAAAVEDSASIIYEALRNGGQVLLAGNGGSAAQAQHFAGELVGRFQRERGPLPALALTADPVTLTAIANDFGYEWVFERQLVAHAHEDTVLVAISTSGSSLNVLRAVDAARGIGVTVIGMTGQPGEPLRWRCDRAIVAPSTQTPLIQQIHLVAAHLICDVIDRGFAS